MTIKQLLDMLPFDGAKGVIGAVALILYGIGGLITGKVDQQTSVQCILAGWTALGVLHKQMKIAQTVSVTQMEVGNKTI